MEGKGKGHAGICFSPLRALFKVPRRHCPTVIMMCIASVSREFEDLLHDKAPLEAYTEWLESMVNRCILLVSFITGCAVAQHCCNDDQQSQWENGKFDPL